MKKLFLLMPLVLLAAMACTKEEATPIKEVPVIQASASNLLFLREEEKLARDVYLFAAALYPQSPIFGNIASSEQTHMDRTLSVLQAYQLADPAAGKAAGEFTDTTLQQLYVQLTAKAALGLADALWVGATIEDLDIADINHMFTANDVQADMSTLYEQLRCGSKNHLRAFTSQLLAQGVTYTPQYLDEATYNAILAGSHQNCNQP